MTAANATPRRRRFLDRERRILDIALQLAEQEGWEAVTTRRLAEAIDYSQPVIYQHFVNRDELIRTLILEGFAALTERLEQVKGGSDASLLEAACRTYVAFAEEHPRLYEAMFTRVTTLEFAQDDSPAELKAAFAALVALVERAAPAAEPLAAAELFWACCHGLVTLHSAQRIPSERFDQHIRALATIVR